MPIQAEPRPVLVELDRVFKFFRPDSAVLSGVSIRIERGSFVYVTGPSGAGKSTLLKLIYRAEVPDHGRVLFCGRDIGKLQSRGVPFLRRNIGVVFQDFKVLRNRSAFDNVALALEVLGAPSRVIRSKVRDVLASVGLEGREGELAGNLSGGEQQRVAIARALVNDPPLILADEPTGNLDPQLAMDVAGLFDDANAAGTTVIFATHDRAILSSKARRTIALVDGAAVDVTPKAASVTLAEPAAMVA